MDLPKVLIGGFPRSGTSFLCNLVAEMGFSPGPLATLKSADANNRWGYWEYLPIRNLVWRAAFRHPKGARKYSQPKFFRRKVLEREHPTAKEIRKVAERGNVEVYKDVMLPLVYRLFPDTCKCVVIERDNLKRMYRYRARQWRWETFLDSLRDYNLLVKRMSEELPCLIVRYEEFEDDFNGLCGKIADFLSVDRDTIDLVRLENIYQPQG